MVRNTEIENAEKERMKNSENNAEKTVAFYTLGCKVNQYETEVIKKDFLSVAVFCITGHQPCLIEITDCKLIVNYLKG